MKQIIFFLLLVITITATHAQQQLTTTPPHLWYKYGYTVGRDIAYFGKSITGIGDLNSDGFDDVLIANNNENKVFLFLGGSPMDTTPYLVFRHGQNNFGRIVVNLGDIDNDGKNDFAIADWENICLYKGGTLDTVPFTVLQATYTTNINGIGDVNEDSFDDILLSDVAWNNYQGKAWLYFGGHPMDTIPDWSAVGDSERYWFGEYVSGKGDVNNDGFKDFVIGGFREVINGSYVKLYLGGVNVDTIPKLVFRQDQLPQDIGIPFIINDLNGDHYDEIAISGDTGIYVYLG